MSKITTFTEATAALTRYVPPAKSFDAAKYSLDTMKDLMSQLGNPQDSFRVVHVAGTSGKTSTCYYVAAMLKAAGKKVGLTVSPHVDQVNERVQIDLVPLAEAEYCAQLTKFLELIEKSTIKPSYFEVLVAFAYWQFAVSSVEYAVVEVGMGGLLDGTNVVTNPNKVSVITDIGFDHTEFLGDTLTKIAGQKAGIVLPGSQVFVNQQGPEVLNEVQRVADKQHAVLHIISEDATHSFAASLPAFQRRNWLLAEGAFSYIAKRDGLTASKDALEQTTTTYIPARMEVATTNGKTFITDASHNGQKLHALMTSIEEGYPNQTIAALVSFSSGDMQRVQEGLQEIITRATHITFTTFSGTQDMPKRPVPPEELAAYCADRGFTNSAIVSDPAAAFTEFSQRPEQLLLITGSFFLLNHIRPMIRQLSAL